MKLDFDFKIKCPEDFRSNQLWKEFIQWLNDEYSESYSGNSTWCYYGVEDWTECSDIRNSDVEEISLERWKKWKEHWYPKPTFKVWDIVTWINSTVYWVTNSRAIMEVIKLYDDHDADNRQMQVMVLSHNDKEEQDSIWETFTVTCSLFKKVDNSWVIKTLPEEYCVRCPEDFITNKDWKYFIQYHNEKYKLTHWSWNMVNTCYGVENKDSNCQDEPWWEILTLQKWTNIMNHNTVTEIQWVSLASNATAPTYNAVSDTYVSEDKIDTKIKKAVDDIAKKWVEDYTTLNTNKQTMNTYSKLKMESFFADKKNIKSIDTMKADLEAFQDIFHIAKLNIQNMEYKANELVSRFDNAVRDDDFEVVEKLLQDNEVLIEFMRNYSENTIRSVGTPKVEPKDPLKFFE